MLSGLALPLLALPLLVLALPSKYDRRTRGKTLLTTLRVKRSLLVQHMSLSRRVVVVRLVPASVVESVPASAVVLVPASAAESVPASAVESVPADVAALVLLAVK
jgi:hypothetical protein